MSNYPVHAGQIRTRRNLVAGEVTARAPRHSCVLLVAIFTPNAFLFPKVYVFDFVLDTFARK